MPPEIIIIAVSRITNRVTFSILGILLFIVCMNTFFATWRVQQIKMISQAVLKGTLGEYQFSKSWKKNDGSNLGRDNISPIFSSPYVAKPKSHPNVRVPYTISAKKAVKLNYTIISFHNPPRWFLRQVNDFFREGNQFCPVKECYVDVNGLLKATADVLWFFHPLNPGMPDRPVGQIWAFASWESPQNYRYPSPYEMWKDKFNWTISYRRDADWFIPVSKLHWRDPRELLSEEEYVSIAKGKTKMAAWWVSHCYTSSRRGAYVRELQKYIDVDIFGHCGPLSCPKTDITACERDLSTKYRFYLSFENSLCRDYVTEKYFRMFTYRTHIIPVGRSGFNYKEFIPGNFTVDAADFKSARALAGYLKALAADVPRYAKMLQEKDKLFAVNVNGNMDWCHMCQRLRTGDYNNRTYPDIKAWSHANGICNPVRDIHG